MIIAASNLPKYVHGLTFPVEIRAERSNDVVFKVDQYNFLAMAEMGTIIGIGSWNRIKWFRLNRPMEKLVAVRQKTQFTCKAEDDKTTHIVSRTQSHHAARSSAYSRDGLQAISKHCV